DIYDSNERMVELVNALLNISRIESGRLIIEPKMVDLGELVKDVLKELTPRVETKKLHLSLNIADNLPKISVDPKLIREAYTNLLTNSIKYTPEEGKISISISESGKDILSQVADSGYGIPKSEKEKV